MKRYDKPQVIINLCGTNIKGDFFEVGDRVTEIKCQKDSDIHFEGTLDVEIVDYPKIGSTLILCFPLPELMKAIASATLNRSEV